MTPKCATAFRQLNSLGLCFASARVAGHLYLNEVDQRRKPGAKYFIFLKYQTNVAPKQTKHRCFLMAYKVLSPT
ncbi:MAG: hypothetical protein QM579_03255 [Desulfovibrio sp.]|uniref:hypothetical protein n=1 Tax=Desulfovibrio sp. TaxID=885 RepID=UPI0039E503DE